MCQALLDWFLLLLATTGLVFGVGGLVLDWFRGAGGTTGLDTLWVKRNWFRCTIGLDTLCGKGPWSMLMWSWVCQTLKILMTVSGTKLLTFEFWHKYSTNTILHIDCIIWHPLKNTISHGKSPFINGHPLFLLIHLFIFSSFQLYHSLTFPGPWLITNTQSTLPNLIQ